MIHLNNDTANENSSCELDDSLEQHINIVNTERKKRRLVRSTFEILNSQREAIKADNNPIDFSAKLGNRYTIKFE